jgi:exodeoxyribonuclease VII large subunit
MTDAPQAGAPATLENPWPVALLSNKIKGYIDRLGTAWVEGQITQWGVSGSNVYGKLRDVTDDVTIGFTIWSSVRGRIPDDLKQGDRVVALVKPNYWLKGGTLTMQVFDMWGWATCSSDSSDCGDNWHPRACSRRRERDACPSCRTA